MSKAQVLSTCLVFSHIKYMRFPPGIQRIFPFLIFNREKSLQYFYIREIPMKAQQPDIAPPRSSGQPGHIIFTVIGNGMGPLKRIVPSSKLRSPL